MAWGLNSIIPFTFLVIIFRDLSSTSGLVSATGCADECQDLYNFYNRFRISQFRLNLIYRSCMAQCPPVVQTTEATTTTTRRTTPKRTTKHWYQWWMITKPTTQPPTRPTQRTNRTPRPWWKPTEPTTQPPTRPTQRTNRTPRPWWKPTEPTTQPPTRPTQRTNRTPRPWWKPTEPTTQPQTRPTQRTNRTPRPWWKPTAIPDVTPKPTTKPTTQPTKKGGLPTVCGIKPAVQRIVGGQLAGECEFPWMVSVISIYFCGGTIIDRRHVLTAAHCFKYKDGSLAPIARVKVRVGSSEMSFLKTYTIQAMQINPKHVYSINDYDVAVLTLSEDLVYGTCVAPVCVADVNKRPSTTDLCYAAGWGVKHFQSRQTQNHLQKVLLPIIPNSTCRNAYGSVLVNDLKICAGDFEKGGVDTCTGDSGGPLMCKQDGVWVQHGIVSFGRGCAEPRRPGVYTRLSHPDIRQFIEDAVKDTQEQ